MTTTAAERTNAAPDALGRRAVLPSRRAWGLPAASDLPGEGDGPGAEVEGGSDWGLHLVAPHVT